MGEFFGRIYWWLRDFFGENMAYYLQGKVYELPNCFPRIGLIMLVISLATVLVFYYAINHPRLNNWWGWTIFLAVNALINFIWGAVWASRYPNGLVQIPDPATGDTYALVFGSSQFIGFGLANTILSVIVFIIFTFIFKWGSSNCSRAPFIK